MNETLLAMLVAALVAGLGGLFVPRLIASVPEPEPDPEAEADPEDEAEPSVPVTPEEPKELYRDIAALPQLAVRTGLVAAVVGAAVGAGIGWHWTLAVWTALVPVGVALGLIDWRTKLLPTWLIRPTYLVLVPVVVAGTLLFDSPADLLPVLLGWLFAGGLYFLLWFVHPRGLGYGDVRLSGILGIALGLVGWSELVFGVWVGFLLGGVGGILLAALRLVQKRALPFGPFMLLGSVVGLLAGEQAMALLAG